MTTAAVVVIAIGITREMEEGGRSGCDTAIDAAQRPLAIVEWGARDVTGSRISELLFKSLEFGELCR